jgi:lysophospholipase-3
VDPKFILLCEYRLKYDRNTGQYSSSDSDIKIKVPGFGGTETVEQLSQTGLTDLPYFKDLVKYFVDRGYERGKSIRAAPYDWRYGPGEIISAL